MVVGDPGAELIGLVRALGDPAPGDATPVEASASAQRAATLVRRRFGLALPAPFAGRPGRDEPVRTATAMDGAAVAAVKWRAFGTSYRGGILPDAFLDSRDVVPPVSFWTGRAMVPPSRRHRLLVWGRPGTVFGYADCGPVLPDEVGDPWPDAGEVYELYVDPAAQGLGGGAQLLEAAEAWLAEAGYARAELSTLDANARARAFYEARGWESTGQVDHVDLGVVAFDEVRYARSVGPARP